MKRIMAILAGIALFGAACSFYWNGPVEVRTKDGRKYDCIKAYSPNPYEIKCNLSEKVVVAIPWEEVAGLTIK